MNQETLGPAERIIQTILAYTDHMVHNRPGMVVADPSSAVGVRWVPVTHRLEEGRRVVYQLHKVGRMSTRTRIGTLQEANLILASPGQIAGEYRPSGIFPEVAVWMYRQVAAVWRLDNEFASRWASFAFGQDHRDLKVVLAAFMLVQCRKGDPIVEGGKVAFYDEDFRDVGEAMLLLQRKDARDLNPKLLLRVRDVLSLPGVAAINRELGFGKTARHPFLGRWGKAVEKWLRYREQNPKMLEGLVKAGFRSTIMVLARHVGYKPEGSRFFEILRWKQAQAEDGRRTVGIGKEVKAAESWTGLSESEICERIVQAKPNFKRIVGLLPKEVGLTRAVAAAAIEAGSLSNKDLVIYAPTIEELGLLDVQDIRERWERAVKAAEDMRAANIASRMKTAAAKEKLEEASDNALKRAVDASMKGIRVYFMVDISGSMQGAIEAAKDHISRFLQGFPPDKVHVSVFNTTGREIRISHASATGVKNAFRGIVAGGGTDYGAGVRALQQLRPAVGEDVLFMFVGDEEAQPFDAQVRASGLNPMAFGFVKVRNSPGYAAVQNTAANLGVPCFLISEQTFADPYAIPRTIRALVAATPVGALTTDVAAVRVSLAETIVRTAILKKPAWAA